MTPDRAVGAVDRDAVPVACIPTGWTALDAAIGVGGYPRGRVVEVAGPAGSGRSTIALHAIASAQAAGGTVALVDADHAIDLDAARTAGVDLDHLLIAQPDTGAAALALVEALARSGACDLIVVDSIAAFADADVAHEGLHARLLSLALRKITAIAARTGVVVLFVNEYRRTGGEVTTGGNALKYYSSIRLDVRKIEADNGDVFVRAKVVKNKLSAPFKTADLRFGLPFSGGVR